MDQTTQDLPDDVQQPPQPVQQPVPGTQPPPGPISKAKTKGGVPAKTPPTKAMPTQPRTVATQAQQQPGQPSAKAPTVLQPPPALAPVVQRTQPTQVQPPQVTQPIPDPTVAGPQPQPGSQQGTPGVQPVTGELRAPGPRQQPQPLTQPFVVDHRCLSAFPNELVGFNSGIFYARISAVGAQGFLPPTVPYSRAFAPLSAARDPRLPASLRQHGHQLEGFCLCLCPVCQRQACSRSLTLTKPGGAWHTHHECPRCHEPSRGPSQRRYSVQMKSC